MNKKLVILAGSLAMLVLAAGVVVTTLALYRYGGIEGLSDRVRMQFATERPHDDYVPTPEGAAAASDEAELAVLAAALPAVGEAPQSTPTAPQRFTPRQEQSKLASLNEPSDVPARPKAQATATATKPAPTATAKPKATAVAAKAAPTRDSAFPPALRLEGLAHYWQTWNNCGPATLSMNLSYFGIKIGQEKIGPVLKPEKDDKNVGPEQLAEYARGQGLNARVRVNGDSDRLKALLQAGVPVLVETWYEPKPNDGMGHYRLIVGYDDAGAGAGEGYWIGYDSYDSHGIQKGDPYHGVQFLYAGFEQIWKVFDYTYIPIYDQGRAAAVEAILGADLDDAAMWGRSLTENLATVQANPKDAFAWFNIGTDYVNLGNNEAAAQAYDTARRLKLPWRMLWYQFGPFQAYFQMGRYQEVIDLADATLKTAVNDEELYYWKGLAQQALGDPASARNSFQAALKQRPTYQDALNALGKLQ